MRYMLLIYNNPGFYEAWSEEDRTALFSEVDQTTPSSASPASWSPARRGRRLEHRTVRVRDGVPAVSDGPFAEAKEHLAGF